MPAHIKFKQEIFSGLTTPSSAYTSVFVGKTAGAPSYNQGNISARLADGQLYRVPYLEEDLTYATGKEFKGNVDIAKDLTVYGTLNWSGSSSDTFVTGGTVSESTLTLTRNDGQNINIPGFLTLSGNTSGTCIDTLWVSTISGCSPVYIGSDVIIPGNLNIGKDIWFGWGEDTEGAIAIHSISGGTTGTTVMGSESLLMNKSLATNVKTATNIYPSYSQYSFSTTGMTGTSITSASKIYSSFKNKRFTNFIGIYPLTSSGGEGDCPCTDQWCDESTGDLCAGTSTNCGCMGPTNDGGGGMYAIGSIDTVSGTTGTTMITSKSIEITTSDVGGTNLLTINPDGITMSNETEGFTSQMSKRVTTTIVSGSVQLLGTPVTLIEEPGAGKMLNIMGITLGLQGEGGPIIPYAGGTTLNFGFAGADTPLFTSSQILVSSKDRQTQIPMVAESIIPDATQILADTAFQVVAPAGNPTTGNGILHISILYKEVDTLF